MKKTKRVIIWLSGLLITLYVIICGWFYFSHEKLLFNTVKVKPDHVFTFSDPFEEHYVSMKDSIKLHGVLFKSKESKGLLL